MFFFLKLFPDYESGVYMVLIFEEPFIFSERSLFSVPFFLF